MTVFFSEATFDKVLDNLCADVDFVSAIRHIDSSMVGWHCNLFLHFIIGHVSIHSMTVFFLEATFDKVLDNLCVDVDFVSAIRHIDSSMVGWHCNLFLHFIIGHVSIHSMTVFFLEATFDKVLDNLYVDVDFVSAIRHIDSSMDRRRSSDSSDKWDRSFKRQPDVEKSKNGGGVNLKDT
ncbi:hypothetical protein Q3G72_032968 [Acer saccharum]|nr:hypothetical protein Q3G72_032968 [Acer saccharum]